MTDKKVKTTKAKATKAKATKAKATKVKVTLVRSPIGIGKKHQACVAGLGLRRMHHSVEVIDTPQNRGMINKVSYMLKCEEV